MEAFGEKKYSRDDFKYELSFLCKNYCSLMLDFQNEDDGLVNILNKKEMDQCEGRVRVRGNRFLEKAGMSCLIRHFSQLPNTRDNFRVACIELIDLFREFKGLRVLAGS